MITDKKVNNKYGILLVNQRDLESIRTNSGELAETNEYQVHFYSLNFRCWLDNEFIDIGIPTVYYNYPQTVSGSDIKFDLRDVISVSEKIKPLVNEKEKQLIGSNFHKELEKTFDNVECIRESMNNIHRHPGKLHSFSGTDYSKDKKNPGICFPLETSDNTAIFSGIITHEPFELGHFEYRVANGSVSYEQGYCFAYVKGYSEEKTRMMSMLGIEPKIVQSYRLGTKYNIVDTIAGLFEKMNYNANTIAILEKNIKEKSYSTTRYSGSKYFDNQNVIIHKNQTDMISEFYDKETLSTLDKKYGSGKFKEEDILLEDPVYGSIFKEDIELFREDLVSYYGFSKREAQKMSDEDVVSCLKQLDGYDDEKEDELWY